MSAYSVKLTGANNQPPFPYRNPSLGRPSLCVLLRRTTKTCSLYESKTWIVTLLSLIVLFCILQIRLEYGYGWSQLTAVDGHVTVDGNTGWSRHSGW